MNGIGLLLVGLGHLHGLSITVSYPKTVMGQFTGRIYVFVSKDPTREPRLGPDWKSPAPILVADVKQSKPDTDIAIDQADASGLSAGLSSLPPGDYTFQAVIDRNPQSPRVGDGDGNLYSAPARAHLDSSGVTLKLVCDQVIDEPTVHQTGSVKVAELESIELSNAQRRAVVWRAVVVLPTEFASRPDQRFPMVLDIPDRGESYSDYPSRESNRAAYRDGKPFVYVRLDPESATGYHVMVDSANNGPYAKALVQEFLPYLAKTYHGDLTRVLVSGVGAGGQSAINLQVTQPTAFAGCWAVSPDSVDFHNFRGLDLYSDGNAFRTEQGSAPTSPRAWNRDKSEEWIVHAKIEKVLRGYSIAGWEADFSPKGKNGKPTPLFDRTSGQIDPAVAKAWVANDPSAILTANWATLQPSLAGKIHIVAQEGDPSFHFEAIRRLDAAMTQLGAKLDITLQPPAWTGPKGREALLDQVDRDEAAACYPRG